MFESCGDFEGRNRAWRRALCLGVAAAAVAAAGGAGAQTASPPQDAAAKEPTQHFNQPRQPLAKALNAFGRKFGVETVFDPAVVRGKTAPALQGDFTSKEALRQLLAGSGLVFTRTEGGVYMIAPRLADEEPSAGVPDIIVNSRRWTLNTGIRRTQDDSQPYVVFTHDQIARSGAVSLEQFLRDNLTSNVSAATADDPGNGAGQGISAVNLRSLGANKTLILIDGRRVPGVSNTADANQGTAGQAQIAGIPIDSIERIEVLASSASGIYGSNASGGVINIILRRDYQSLQATATGGGTFDGGGSNMRFDVSGGTKLENGRTKISFSASYSKQNPLYVGQRDFLQDGYAHILAASPNFFTTAGQGLGRSILGSTPNIRSSNNAALVLKGGVSLGSPITFLPAGYTAAAGTAPLVANAGKYNLDLAPTSDGARAPVLIGSHTITGTVAIEREFAPWLKVYVSGSASDTRTVRARSNVSNTFTLSSTAPNNPFTQNVIVTFPQVGADSSSKSKAQSFSVLGGATVKLPFRWQAILDGSWNRNTYSGLTDRGPITAGTDLAILNGTSNILQDLRVNPIPYAFEPIPSGQSQSKSWGETFSLRLAGPIPFRLPGGEPVVTLLAERDVSHMDAIVQWLNGAPPTQIPTGSASTLTLAQVLNATTSSTTYLPPRSQATDSAYGEIRIPLVGSANRVPLIQALDLQFAGRFDRYDETALLNGTITDPVSAAQIAAILGTPLQLEPFTNLLSNCGATKGPLTAAGLAAPCPTSAIELVKGESVRNAFSPSLSLKWTISRDIAFRGSYATGFIPPLLTQLSPEPLNYNPVGLYRQFGINLYGAKDPARGGEVIGASTDLIAVLDGGNPNIKPETSKTWSGGVIVTPRWVPGLRVSADWTHIVERNRYFYPSALLSANTPGTQAAFEEFLKENPDRFIRGAPSGGFAVGPIIQIDQTIANALGTTVDALDVTLQYTHEFPGVGVLAFDAAGTYLDRVTYQINTSSPLRQAAGVGGGGWATGLAGVFGGVRLKGNASVNWSTKKWSLGMRVRYFGSYYFDSDHSVIPAGQGANSVPAQAYVDLFATYKLPFKSELRLVVNNLFDKAAPFDVTTGSLYSRFGDPRRGSFYLSVVKTF